MSSAPSTAAAPIPNFKPVPPNPAYTHDTNSDIIPLLPVYSFPSPPPPAQLTAQLEADFQLARSIRAHEGIVITLRVSPDERMIATAGLADKTIALWDWEGTRLCSVTLPESTNALVFSDDDSRVLFVGLDKGATHCIDVHPGRLGESRFEIPVSPSARFVVEVSDVWYARGLLLISSVGRDESGFTLGTEVLTVDYETNTFQRVLMVRALEVPVWRGVISSCRRFVVQGFADGAVHLHRLRWEDPIDTQHHKAFAPGDGDTDDPAGHVGGILSVTFAHALPLMLTGCAGGRLTLTNLDDLDADRVIFRHHSNAVFAAVFSPTDRFVVSGSRDRTICVASVSGDLLMRIQHAHMDTIEGFGFSGNRLVSCAADYLLRFWTLPSFLGWQELFVPFLFGKSSPESALYRSYFKHPLCEEHLLPIIFQFLSGRQRFLHT